MDSASEELSVDLGSGPSHLLGRVIQTFFSPGRVMRDLSREPKTIGVLLLGGVLVGLANAAIPAEIWEQLVRSQLSAVGEEVPSDLATPVAIARWGASIGGMIFWPILGVLVASIYSLVFLAGLGYEGRYSQYLSVTAHALMIGAVGAVALTPLRILTEDVQLTLTVGAFVPILEEGLLARFLGCLDLLNLWVAALIGLGASIIDGKRHAGASILFALGTSVLVALLLATLIA